METTHPVPAEQRQVSIRKVRMVGGLLAALGLVAIVAAVSITLSAVMVFGVLLFGVVLCAWGTMKIVQSMRSRSAGSND